MSHPKQEGQTWLAWDAEHGEGDGGGPPQWERDPDTGLWYDPGSGDYAPKWMQEQLNQGDSGGSLEDDLAAIGLLPVRTGGEQRPTSGLAPERGIVDPYGGAHNTRATPYLQDEAGQFYERDGSPVTVAKQKALSGQYAAGGDGGNPYAGAANARAERTMRMNEAMDAITARRQSIQAYQQAQLEGAGFSLPAGTEWMPQLSPTSPVVRSGLADPMRANLINFDPAMVLDPGQQWQQDLARLRAGAGVG